jgi:OOP family OmpA-OmpF porin
VCRLGIAVAVGLAAFGGSSTAAADSPWYVQGRVGQSSYQATVGQGAWFFDGDDESAAVEVGYALNPYIALEAGYHELGRFGGSGSPCALDAVACVAIVVPVEADISGLSVAAVPRYPLTDRFSVYGKVGVIDWTTDISHGSEIFGRGRIDSLSGQDLLAAVGAQVDFRRGFGVAIEYEELDFDVGSTSLGLSYRF